MNLSKNITFKTITAAVFAAGLSMPLYAADPATTADPADMSQTTKVVTTTTTSHMAKHKAHHVKMRTSKTTDVQQESMGSDKGVVMKNGIEFHDVEPTAESQNSPFGAPTSTDDTLKGGITSTLAPAPTH